MERQHSGLTIIGFTVLAFNSGLAIYNSGGPSNASHGTAEYSGLTVIGCTVLSCNSGLAIYNSWGDDTASVAFVLLADAALLLLFLCLCKLERARAGRRGGLKAAVWAFTTLLTATFASRVAPLMPLAVATVVWLMAAATTAGGFWAFFLS